MSEKKEQGYDHGVGATKRRFRDLIKSHQGNILLQVRGPKKSSSCTLNRLTEVRRESRLQQDDHCVLASVRRLET